MTLDIIRQILENHLGKLFTPYTEECFHEMGENKDKSLYVDKNVFFSHFATCLQSQKNLNLRHLVVSVFTAYNLCFDKKFDDDCFILYPAHTRPIHYVLDICQQFQKAYFLYIVREPSQNMGSVFKRMHDIKMYGNYNVVKSICSEILNEYVLYWPINNYHCYNKTPYHDDTNNIVSRYIRLEDVHKTPEKIMQEISHWLDIDFTSSLMQSTFMGLLWHNRRQTLRANGFDENIIKQTYPDYVNKFDQYRLKLLAYRERSYFNYGTANYLEKLIYILLLPLLLLYPFKVEYNHQRFFFNMKNHMNFWLNMVTNNDMKYKKIGLLLCHPIGFCLLYPLYMFFIYGHFLIKVFYSYYDSRKFLWQLWYKKLFHDDSKNYVKPLC